MATIVLSRSPSLAIGKVKLHREAIGAFIVLAAGLHQLRPALDPDLGWHLRDGQVILATHAIPRVDAYSFTFTGAPWVDFEWLWESALAAINGWGGILATIVANSLLTMAGCALIYGALRLRQLPPLMAGFGVAFAALNLYPYADVRPGMMGALLAAGFVFILELARARANWRWLLLLLPAQLVWANSHGSYLEGPVLCGVYGLGAICDSVSGGMSPLWSRVWFQVRHVGLRWAGLCAGLAAVSLMNPLGLGLLRFTVGASRLSTNQDYNGEWAAPNFHAQWTVPLLLSILASIALPLLSQRARPSKREGLILCVATLAAMRSGQFIAFYAAVAAPILAGMLTRAFNRPWRLQLSAIHGCLFGVAILILGAGASQVLQPGEYQSALSERFPVNAVGYIQQQNLDGPMWNNFDWGCYLITALPRLPVFIDGRTEMYGDTFFKDYYNVETGVTSPRPLLDRWGINLVLTSVKSPMATVLRDDPAWSEDFHDDLAAVFVRAGSQPDHSPN